MFYFLKKIKLYQIIFFFIFSILGIFIIFNYGLYHDDWGFFVQNNFSFKEHVSYIWEIEGKLLNRYVNVPFYVLTSIIGNIKLIYLFWLIVGLFICWQLHDLFKLVFEKSTLKNNYIFIEQYLPSLILLWYFLPFNIGGQVWTADLHVKVSFVFFLAHFQFLLRNKFFLTILCQILAFNSYEMFYFLNFTFVVIFFIIGSINGKELKKYIYYSILILIFFIIDRKRDYYEFELFSFIYNNLVNIPRFFYAIYSSFQTYLHPILFIILMLPIFYPIKKFWLSSQLEKKNKIYFIFLIILSFCLNSAILVGGHYGFTGQGVFSRSMYGASFIILFFLIFIFSIAVNRNNTLVIIYFTFISILGFVGESLNWKKSWRVQTEVFNSDILKNNKDEFDLSKKYIVIFKGPCSINGVEIFAAPWDITRSMVSRNLEFENLNFIPIQNWEAKITDKVKNKQYDQDKINQFKKFLKIHTYYYPLEKYEGIYLWDYFKNKSEILIKYDSKYLLSLNESEIYDINNQLKKINETSKCQIDTKNYKNNLSILKKIFKTQFFKIT